MNQHQGQEMNSIESEERLVIAKIGRKSTIKNLALYIYWFVTILENSQKV